MSKLKDVILEVLNENSKEEVLRVDLATKVEKASGIRPSEVHKFLAVGDLDESIVIKRNPILLHRRNLIAWLEEIDKPMSVGRGGIAVNDIPDIPNVETNELDASQDPSLDKFFPTKSYSLVLRRMNPQFPFNIFIYGDAGVGKSTAALHVAKIQGRTAIRINLSKFSDVDDLFGGMRISDGTTYFEKGPALVAMELGAIFIIDECDSADPHLLTDLHPILEKRGYFVKKLRKMVYPAPGFCIVATANTKGRGDMTGKYVGTNILNRAFLDRFATGIEFESPSAIEMTSIVKTVLPSANTVIVNAVVEWYNQIQNAYKKNAIDDHVSPRKILDIIELMMSEKITIPESSAARECIRESTSLYDEHVSFAFTEMWSIIK